MATITPPALNKVYGWIAPYLKTEARGGIVNPNSPGYHTSREDLIRQGRSTNYSIQAPADKRGNAQYAAGIDITFGSLAELVVVHKRLRAACTPDSKGEYDPRIECVREVIGTLDGKNVSGYNRYASGTGTRGKVGWVSSGFSDSSHLWHEHISIFRDRVNDENEMKGLAEVIAGLPAGALGWEGKIDGDVVDPPVVVDPEPPVVVPPIVTPPVNTKKYVVKSGDTLTKIAKSLGLDGWKSIADLNPGINVNLLKAGQVLNVPASSKPTTPEKPATDPKPEVPVTTATETVFGWNILRRTDIEPGRKRWGTRRPLIGKTLRAAKASVYLLNETDQSTRADCAEELGSKFNYWGFKYYGIYWDTDVWERAGDATNEFEFRDNNNRFLLSLPLRHKKTGKIVVFDCTHLENDGDPKTDGHKARFIEATHLSEKAKSGNRIGFWDCNSTTPPTKKPTTERQSQKPRVVLAMKIGARFLSSLGSSKVKNLAYGSHHGGKSGVKGPMIDDAWAVGDVEIIDGEVVRTDSTDASDHNALKFRIKF